MSALGLDIQGGPFPSCVLGHLHEMNSSNSPPVLHLLTSWNQHGRRAVSDPRISGIDLMTVFHVFAGAGAGGGVRVLPGGVREAHRAGRDRQEPPETYHHRTAK